MKEEDSFIPAAAAFACGLVVCLAIVMATGRSEAWDDAAYYLLGMPAMCIVAFALGRRFPVRPWRWAAWMAGGQCVAAVLNGSSLSLLPFALVFMLVISIPQFIAASLGARRAAGRGGRR